MGALTPEDGKTIANALEMALDKRLPAILLLASSGADANHGVAALHGWGTAARVLSKCSGVIPVIAAVTGPAVSGTALLIGLADIVVMTETAYAFVSGPIPVRQMTGVQISQQELGGSDVHHRETGVASIIVSDNEVLQTIAEILQFFPNYNGLEAPKIATNDLDDRLTPEASDVLPETPSGSYDVREIIQHIADDNYFVELRSGWATNLVTGLASFGGRSVGVIANQPISIAGTLDIPASQKGARFVAMCDAFNLPLITLVDTPGFYPGKDLEWRGMIRHGAQLAFAYARATVPRIAIVLRKSYGGAFIVMDSKTIGNDAYLAWPTAEIAVMGATQAAQILQRGASDAEIEEYVTEYDSTYLNPYIGAERGFVDAVIDPKQTRRELIDLLDLLSTKKEKIPVRRHDNSPL
jgi:acetyl-CoA carboxylase carboxyltransferase component|tara:strand:- start:6069 stop:7301 length:1233 start_codon:yes stop_codon:yes gene_type:complete